MKRINLIMMSVFIGGILLMGIGIGVAFGEYSGFTYGGERQIGDGETKEIVLEHEIATGKDAKKTLVYSQMTSENFEIKEDKKVPEGMVQYQVTYDKAFDAPYLEYIGYDEYDYYEEEEARYEGELYLVFGGGNNEVKWFFQCKDEILKDLKEGKLCSYEYQPLTKVVVKVNPKTRKYLKEIM